MVLTIRYTNAARSPEAGIVNTQAVRMCPATPQRTLLSRSADPTPRMAELTTWVVLTGPPSNAALMITTVDVTWEVKPCTGRIL